MNYRVEEIERRLLSSKDSGWEFKQVKSAGDRPRRPTRNEWANEIATFANAAGGVVLAGVADDGSVIDMSRAQIANLDALLVEVSTDTIRPPVRTRTHHKELSDGKMVLLAEVAESDCVHESPGGNYIRVGASKQLMGGNEWLCLAQRWSQAHFLWFDKQPVPGNGFAAAPGHAAYLERDWTPCERTLAIDPAALPEGGSVNFPEATGHLPGLKGRLNPKRGTHDRTYLHASNIAIDEGKQQPAHSTPGEELQLTDAERIELRVRIVDNVGHSALVEYFDARRESR